MNSPDPLVRPGIDVHRYYTLDMPQVKSAAFADIFSLTGVRGICEPTKYVIRFTHPRHDLSRSEYLNRMAGFVMQPPVATRWSQPEAPRRISNRDLSDAPYGLLVVRVTCSASRRQGFKAEFTARPTDSTVSKMPRKRKKIGAASPSSAALHGQ